MAPNPHHDDAGNTRHRVLVAGQQYLCSEHESNVTVVTPSRATKVWAVKELHSDLKFSGELKGVWFDVDCNSAVNSSRSHDEQPRWRTTFENQCASLYTVSNHGDFMLSLAQLVPILDRMRLAGFIHGDISPLNCLVHTRDRHIKISDIEHARQYYSEDEGSPPPQIGVPHFMAVEYQRDRYYFDDDVCTCGFCSTVSLIVFARTTLSRSASQSKRVGRCSSTDPSRVPSNATCI
ncbi:hypothetical protein CPB85DRAFT_759788 [Mucidula mucida]|nr:hypothetical protein CPB85DRAFT_759788 [Mucidula mucida]